MYLKEIETTINIALDCTEQHNNHLLVSRGDRTVNYHVPAYEQCPHHRGAFHNWKHCTEVVLEAKIGKHRGRLVWPV